MYQIVKFTFPFADNFDKGKPRPALVISPSFGKYDQFVVAYITARLEDQLETDLLIDSKAKYFPETGFYSTSVIKLHRLITVIPSQTSESIGALPNEMITELKQKLMKVLNLKNN